MSKGNTFYVSFRMGPAVSQVYEFGNGVNDYFFIPVNNNFLGSSWSKKDPLVIEATTEVNDAIKGLSINQGFHIERIRLFIPLGVDSPTTQPVASLAALRIYQGKMNGTYNVRRFPTIGAYDRQKKDIRVFDFFPNCFFDQWSAIEIETPSFVANWTAGLPTATMEIMYSKAGNKVYYAV